MKLKLSENPKEWRKTAWMTAMGLAVFTGILRWRGILPFAVCCVIWCLLAVAGTAAGIQPRWFRGFYNFSMRLGFGISQIAGKIVLAAFFVVVITPLGIVRRALGKDPLRLRRRTVESYWTPVPKKTPLERLF
ncbi:MAG TPA: SxtJ family membrane protein [Verrucomicrobiae bacterium]|jgi:hypothetical protein|nr:SxtJ family membrane protein [Verrucomicrobiae bacterium]